MHIDHTQNWNDDFIGSCGFIFTNISLTMLIFIRCGDQFTRDLYLYNH